MIVTNRRYKIHIRNTGNPQETNKTQIQGREMQGAHKTEYELQNTRRAQIQVAAYTKDAVTSYTEYARDTYTSYKIKRTRIGYSILVHKIYTEYAYNLQNSQQVQEIQVIQNMCSYKLHELCEAYTEYILALSRQGK